ncbi:MAG: c-type cytochrome, partial [Polyangiales bacterium]
MSRRTFLSELTVACALGFFACTRPQPPRPEPQAPKPSAASPAAKPAPPAAPPPAPAPSIQQGQAAYVRICAVCHGQNGQGYVADQAPALAQPDFLSSVNDELMRRAITHGRPGSTMSAWSTARGGPLAPADVDA